MNVTSYDRLEDGMTDSQFRALFLNYSLKTGADGWIGVQNSVENLREPLEFGEGVEVPPGRHSFTRIQAFHEPSPGSLFGVGWSADVGGFYDGERFDIGVAPTWRVNEHLEIGGEYTLSRLEFDDRNQSLDADITRLRVRSAISAFISTHWFLQYNRAADAVISNLGFRFQMAEGRDLYVVYNHRLNTDRERMDPSLPLTQARSLLVKWTHTFGS